MAESRDSVTNLQISDLNVGDRLKIIGNRAGSVRFVGALFDSDGNECALMSMDDREEKELVPLKNIVMNMGPSDMPEFSIEDDKSNLFRDNSASQWDMQDLENQESALKLSIRRLSQQKSLLDPSSGQSSSSDDEKAGEDSKQADDDRDSVYSDDDEEIKHEGDAETSDLDTNEQPLINVSVGNIQMDKTKSKNCGEICFVSQKSFLVVSLILLMITLAVMITVWELLTQVQRMYTDHIFQIASFVFTVEHVIDQGTTDNLYKSVMAKHRWLALSDKTYDLMERTEMIHDVVAERFHRGDMNMSHRSAVTKFFSNLMQSSVGSNQSLEMYNQYYIYVAIPDGTFHGVRAYELDRQDYPALFAGYALFILIVTISCFRESFGLGFETSSMAMCSPRAWCVTLPLQYYRS